MQGFWHACLERFREELPGQQYNTWIKPLRAQEGEEEITVSAPNRFVMQWVKDKYLARIEEQAAAFYGYPVLVQLVICAPGEDKLPQPDAGVPVKSAPASPVRANGRKEDTSRLNASYTFTNFVPGKANELARAMAMQVADNPGDTYSNPLFVYGGVGLGKTHLIQAIGNQMRAQNPDARISYIHAGRYVSDIVQAYQQKTFEDLRRHYHSLDLLLIDDIQFIGGKNRTQEEFFYAFNELIESRKQIVLTCDTYPKEIAGMEDRLITRFGWGLTVALQPPELEMRVAILLKKAFEENAPIPEDVAFFIAQQIHSNVRELEGGLKRVLAHSRFTGLPVSLELAKEALKDLLAVNTRMISVDNIQRTVADYYKIKVAEMYSKRRSRAVARPRQVAMALARELTHLSLPEIADAFGGRDHTTVLHACRKIEELRAQDPNIHRDISVLMQVLRS
jgi:chromosomal replication initiator protein